MAIEIQNLSELSSDQVATERATIKQRLQDANAGLDLKRGVLHDILLYFAAALSAMWRSTWDRFRRSWSLLEVNRDPTLADTDVVDGIFSNYNITRTAGTQAIGQVTIVVSQKLPVTINAGSVFQAQSKNFRATDSFAAKTDAANVLGVNDRLLLLLTDGNYAFTINVEAEEAGSASKLVKDALLLPTQPPLNFVRAYATSDFSDGIDEETNAEMIDKLQLGIATRGVCGRIHMNAFLRQAAAFPGVVSTSIIGFGNTEMLRDKHTIWPTSLGGKVDYYVRSSLKPLKVSMTKEATLISKDGSVGTWQFGILRDDAPGFYVVDQITQVGADNTVVGSYEITEEIRSNDLGSVEGLEIIPDIVTVEEGAYSMFQAAVIRFADTDTNAFSLPIGLTKRDYTVTVVAMPNIRDIQLLFGGSGYRNPNGDCLIKAPIPCFVSLSFKILLQKGQTTPDTEGIKNSLADVVNNIGFTGRLPASALFDVIHNFIEKPASVPKIEMLGDLRYPDGTIYRFQSTEALLAPDSPAEMVSFRTVSFILDQDDISIDIQTLDTVEL